MLFKRDYRGGKYNPKLCKYGKSPKSFNVAQLVRNYEQAAKSKGFNPSWNALVTMSRAEGEPEHSSNTDGFVEGPMQTFEWNAMDEDDMPSLELMLDDSPSPSKIVIESEVKDSNEKATAASSPTASCDTLIENTNVSSEETDEETAFATSASPNHSSAGEATNTDHRDNKNPPSTTTPLAPFNYPGLPFDAREKILRNLLVSHTNIRPFYPQFSLEVPLAETEDKENYTNLLPALAGNRTLLAEATTVLYGGNLFNLDSGAVARWWLRRIGPANAAKLRRLTLNLDQGVALPFGTRAETCWWDAVRMLPPVGLRSLKVSFAKWTHGEDKADELNANKHHYVWEPRHGVVRALLGLRGLTRAMMTPGPYLSGQFTDVICEAVTMGAGQSDQEVDDLAETMEGPQRTKYVF